MLLSFSLCAQFSTFFFFFFNDTATTEIYTLSLHDALPISSLPSTRVVPTITSPSGIATIGSQAESCSTASTDRKSTRLNSSHLVISYAVFCLKKKKKTKNSSHTHITHSAPLFLHQHAGAWY